jgi:hypothetical protein
MLLIAIYILKYKMTFCLLIKHNRRFFPRILFANTLRSSEVKKFLMFFFIFVILKVGFFLSQFGVKCVLIFIAFILYIL